MSSNSFGNLFAPNERGAALFSACRSALAIVASWWSDANTSRGEASEAITRVENDAAVVPLQIRQTGLRGWEGSR
jgi:hypothetical protein